MANERRSFRETLQAKLLESAAKLPTGSLNRLGRTALTGLRAIGLGRSDQSNAEAISAIVENLGQLKGVAMKAGQIMSYIDVTLPDELRDALSTLQTHSQPLTMERVSEIVRSELGEKASILLECMTPVPVAAASIGQVHRATLPDGRDVAVKIQYPEIATAIANDFGPARFGATLGGLIYPGANLEPLMMEARERFLLECDYQNEAASQERFARIYASHAVIHVPEVLRSYSSRRVLTTEWVQGKHLADFLATSPSQESRDRFGMALFEFYVGTLFTYNLYNCDPHPGNYLFGLDGRLALLDYGCTRSFERAFVDKLRSLSSAVQQDDHGALHDAFVSLEMVDGSEYDFESARDLVRGFYGPMLRDEALVIDPGVAKSFRSLVADKRRLLKLKLPPEFLFLFRIRFGLMSILAQLGARANWYQLERRFVERTPTTADEGLT